ncbi:DNA gyrase inhibitor YacG [Thermosulfurimonas sp. F29]|uniref:DNA gyrase inhibitor YacG n=1 Tax=Thermosulfurimonas sp. F29 TaxID=2867247 RepID=UPI001C82DE07|nr:DNA gyrase inhibitor YacG [Thermosulfurimonas sp. F29]MBX6423675.1 DNA gyrase inhibitor YacG [Thermosulfurimonas sp. F29]
MAGRVRRCPICGRPTSWRKNPYRPFCSERCKLVDLDRWFSEEYRISVSRDTMEAEEEEVKG